MSIDGNADIVKHTSQTSLNSQQVEVITLKNDLALVIGSNALALYRDTAAVGDPLGNGLLATCDIPAKFQLPQSAFPWVKTIRAGYIGLTGELALLILPNEIKLYENGQKALRNQDVLAALPLEH